MPDGGGGVQPRPGWTRSRRQAATVDPQANAAAPVGGPARALFLILEKPPRPLAHPSSLTRSPPARGPGRERRVLDQAPCLNSPAGRHDLAGVPAVASPLGKHGASAGFRRRGLAPLVAVRSGPISTVSSRRIPKTEGTPPVTDRNRQAYLDIARLVLDWAARELARTGRPVVLERAALAMAAIQPNATQPRPHRPWPRRP